MGMESCTVKAPAAGEFTDRLTCTYDNLVKVHA